MQATMALTPTWLNSHAGVFADRKVLITGGAGFIGSHLATALVSLGASVTVLDNLAAGKAENVPAGARFIFGSLLDAPALAEAVTGAEFVFHQAALGSVPRSVEEPELYFEVNVNGTLALLRAAARAKVRRVMFAASSSAYGDTQELPKHEDMPPRPLSPYAASKVAGEALMRAFSNSYGLDTVSLRYFNIFGPRQSPFSAYAAVIAAFAQALLSGKHPQIYGDGSQSRDFTHVDNAVHANLLAAGYSKLLGGEILNVATGLRISVSQLATTMAALLDRADLTADHHPARVGDVLHSQASLLRIESVLKYTPVTHLDGGLSETLEWYRKNLKS